MTQADYNAVVSLGEAAAHLLASPAYQTAMNHLSEFHLMRLVGAVPGNAGQLDRDLHHTLHWAVSQVTTQLAAYVEQSDHLKTDHAAADAASPEYEDY